MTVDGHYVDSSALRQLYVHERRSADMSAWRFKHPGSLGVTRFTRAELVNSMAAAVYRRDVTVAQLQGFLDDLADEFTDGRLHLVEVPWRVVLDQAADLSRQYSPRLGTRTLDVLHVSSAMELGARYFVSYDARQIKLAEACGLKVIQP